MSVERRLSILTGETLARCAGLMASALGALLAVMPCEAAPPAGAASWTSSATVDDSGVLRVWGRQVVAGALAPLRVQLPVAAAKVFAGGSQGFAIDVQGTLWAWGNNSQGQLGDGSVVPRANPVRVGSGFSLVSTGVNHSLGLKSDGSLWAWGSGLFGLIGDGVLTDRRKPVQVGSGYVAAAAGFTHNLAIQADGRVWTWGRNQSGQLGNGTTSTVSVNLPTAIELTAQVVAAGSEHSLALQTDGSLWAWGDNYYGQLGDGTRTDASTPRRIGTGYAAIAATGYSSLGLKTDGTLWVWGYRSTEDGRGGIQPTPAQILSGVSTMSVGFYHGLALRSGGQLNAWGDNRFGQLGDGSTSTRFNPIAIGTGWAALAAGSLFNVGLQNDGSVWAWGDDYEGQLGNGPPESKTTPTVLASGFRSVAMGLGHNLALKPDGTLWAWGQGNAPLGLGVVGHQRLPRQVGSGFASVAAGNAHSLALKTDGTLWTWGSNVEGQLGHNSEVEWTPRQLGSTVWAAIAAGHSHSLGLQPDTSLWAWGANDAGQLGLGDRNPRAEPVRVGTGFSTVLAGTRFSMALKIDGTLWAWGANGSGQLGLGDFTDASSPRRVGSGYVKVVAGQNHVAALQADGSLWMWGDGRFNQLGDGERRNRATPTKLGDGFADVFSGPTAAHTLALRRDGSLWIWGLNTTGQLGDGTIAASARPLSVVNEQATGLLRLAAPSGTAGPELLAYLLKLQTQGYDLKASLTDLRAAGLLGDVYFSVLAPANSPLTGCTSHCSPGVAAPSRGPQRGPLTALRSTRPLAEGAAPATVAGVISRGGFKQTSGSSGTQADVAYNGDLGRANELSVLTGLSNPLADSTAVICMGVTIPELSAKGQVLMRPIATGSAVQGVAQCPPVQTAATLARFRAQSSGPITARTIVAEVTPLDEERGQLRQVFSWAVTPDGRQYMQTAPNVWEAMTEPMRPVATVTLPSTGSYRLEVTRELDLSGLEGTLVFIGVGSSWAEVRDLNKAGQHTTVQ